MKKIKVRLTKEEKIIANHFKDFYSTTSKRIKSKEKLLNFVANRSEYKDHFFMFEKNIEEYYYYNYLNWTLSSLNKYIEEDTCLSVEDEIIELRDKVLDEINLLEDSLILDEKIFEIMEFSLSGIYSKAKDKTIARIMSEIPGRNSSFSTKQMGSYYKKIKTLGSRKKKEYMERYIIHEVESNEGSKVLLYLEKEYNFIFNLNLIEKHIGTLEEFKHKTFNKLDKLSSSIEKVVKDIFVKDIIPNDIPYEEGRAILSELKQLSSVAG